MNEKPITYVLSLWFPSALFFKSHLRHHSNSNLVCIDDKDDLHICSTNSGWNFYDVALVIMQFTSVKDKNGKRDL